MCGLKTAKVVLLAPLIALLVGSGQSFAQDSVSETYVIRAGTGQGDYRAFVPASVQVHPGDTVRWITRGCIIHFANGETPFWVLGEYEGSPVLNSNPAALVGKVPVSKVFRQRSLDSYVAAIHIDRRCFFAC